ncbi:SIS domain-containing protein [Asticcacaulis sp.]|uniref:SIS domain-containing protein n=1 Tax=Asticcacaulis sp. TaxID=1872648 RepID=UPI002CE5A01B|nr:SIS domain-containing protein [Asticcacaulis sp.]HTM81627.1 SIS domain-containing protein [Asticcacaulis sp.]
MTPFDAERFERSLDGAVAQLDRAVEYGLAIAGTIDRIYFIAPGAPNRIMQGLRYWLETYSSKLEVRCYYPAEFIAMNPPRLDDRTLVVLASKSGKTMESVAVAQFLQSKPCQRVVVTQSADRPIAQFVDIQFLIGETPEPFYGVFMILQALVGGILAGRDDWPLMSQLLASLKALPRVLAQAVVSNDARGASVAADYQNDRILYLLGSGPMFTLTYYVGVCILQESQWMHCLPIEAAELFHGPFEAIDEKLPVVLMLGEDASRPLMERALAFCQRYTERTIVYDSKTIAMPGIDPAVRPILAPYVLGIAVERIAAHLAELHDQPLTTTRYMGKVAY